MSDVVVSIASKRLHRAGGAHNTTQTVGAVWCMSAPGRQPLEERRHRDSVLEEVFLADCNSVFDEESTILLCKTDDTVVLLLLGYISSNCFAVAHTIGKASILLCPAFKAGEVRICFQPLTRRHLEVLYKLGHSQCGRKRHEDMHMVWHAADTEQVSSYVVDEAEDIGVEITFMVYTDSILTAMSSENYMVKGLCITHTGITNKGEIYYTNCTLSPVFDRHSEGYVRQHRTTPSACTVLCAPRARLVSSTQSLNSRVYSEHRTAPSACTVLCAPTARLVSPTQPRNKGESYK